MTRPRNIWDPVWGQIELEDAEWLVLNTRAFQRLRRIHQLGMTMLVFPGATHTRFEHSVGACHVAGLMARRLRALQERGEATIEIGPADIQLVRFAALVHDIGHGPFSHVSDPFLGRKGHEWIGAQAVVQIPALADAVRSTGLDPADVATLIHGSDRRSVHRDIVSGPTDADKIDYLLRDSHYTGARQGLFDHAYLIDQMIGYESVGESLLGFLWGGLWAVEGMKLARHHMHRTVYGHRNRVITDLMLRRGIQAALDEGLLPKDLFLRPSDDEFVEWFERYVEWDDWRVMSTLAWAPSDSRSGRIFRRLRDHDLLKVLVFLEGEEFKRALGEHARRLAAQSDLPRLAAACEARLATELGIEADEIVVHLADQAHVLYAAPDLDEDINFVTPGGAIEPLAERSELYSAMPSPRWLRQLVVYAPVGKRDERLSTRARAVALDALRSAIEESAG